MAESITQRVIKCLRLLEEFGCFGMLQQLRCSASGPGWKNLPRGLSNLSEELPEFPVLNAGSVAVYHKGRQKNYKHAPIRHPQPGQLSWLPSRVHVCIGRKKMGRSVYVIRRIKFIVHTALSSVSSSKDNLCTRNHLINKGSED